MQPIKYFIPLIFALLLATRSPAADETLSGILSVVRGNNPTLKAARANWEAMKARVPQARAWEDPMFGLNTERIATTNFADYTDLAWMLSQTIPVAGKNMSRGRAAIAEAGGAFQAFRRAEYDIISRTRVAYFKLSAAYGQLEINQRNATLLSR